ncbi:hypothetical protein DFJ77DRAFT_513734 [Powellomyces hirtus]|nr:hypothetical protein DFJ77DRAFT_513734 [Powellomyces hirtus]
MTRLRLGQYESALEDALALIVQPVEVASSTSVVNAKAFFRAGRASYELGAFVDARSSYEQALQLNPEDREYFAALTMPRFLTVFLSPRLPAEVEMFLHQLTYSCGDVILVEKAFCNVFGFENEDFGCNSHADRPEAPANGYPHVAPSQGR